MLEGALDHKKEFIIKLALFKEWVRIWKNNLHENIPEG